MNATKLVGSFCVLLAAFLFAFQQPALGQTDQQMGTKSTMDTAGSHGMTMSQHPAMQGMSEVRSECAKTDRSAGTALTDVRAAMSSSDPKVLQEALRKAEKQLSEIQANMANAMKMMNTMHSQTQGGSKTMQHEGMENNRGPNEPDSTMIRK